MPRFSSVGELAHCDIEEMYIILKAKGTLTIEDEKTRASAEGVILNKIAGTHGLVNDLSKEMELLIIQASLKWYQLNKSVNLTVESYQA